MRSSVNLTSDTLDGSDSQFATSPTNPYSWAIIASPPGSNATLVGENTPQAAIMYDGAGDYTVELTVTNAGGVTDTATVDIVVSSVAPTRVQDKPDFSVGEGNTRAITGGFLEFVDADNTPAELTYTVSVAPQFGTVSPATFTQQDLDDGTAVTYAHDGSENFSDQVVFGVTDQTTNLTADFPITITPANDPPTIVINRHAVGSGGRNSVAITNLSICLPATSISTRTSETLSIRSQHHRSAARSTRRRLPRDELNTAGQQPVYTHDGHAGESDGDTDQFTFSLTDDAPATVPGFVFNIDLQPVNNGPTIVAASMTVMEDNARSLAGFLVSQDPDDAAAAITVTITSLPSNGTLEINGSDVTATPAQLTQADVDAGALVYDPDQDFDGTDTFGFSVSDPGGLSQSGTFVVTMTPENDAPVVTIVSALTVNYGEQADINSLSPAIVRLDIMDVDNLDSELTITVTDAPDYGILVDETGGSITAADLANGQLDYSNDPNGNCNTADPEPAACQALVDDASSDSFTFTVTDPGGLSDSGTYTINLNVDFTANINPIFVSSGQNCTACHTAVGGSGGYSLFDDTVTTANIIANFDRTVQERLDGGETTPLADGDPLINETTPANSALLLKPIGAAGHVQRFNLNGNSYRLIDRWIRDGCPGPGPNGANGCVQ